MSAIFNNKFKFCYPVIDINVKTLIKKVKDLDKEKKSLIELRLDYLIREGFDIDQIVDIVNYITEKCTKKKIIATIRTNTDGGKVDLTKEKYFMYIKKLYFNTNVAYIDVEYRFYKIDKVYYDSMFKKHKKKIIISMHFFDRVFDEIQYINMFREMAESKGNIVKFAIKTFSKEDLFLFMNTARNCEFLFKNNNKGTIFIAMGEIGKLSRVWPEYTNTMIVFLTANGGYFDRKLGQTTRKNYIELRKLLAKRLKN